MTRFLLVAAALTLGACRDKHEDLTRRVGSGTVAAQPPSGPDGPAKPGTGGQSSAEVCTPLPFAENSPVPEASGAAWLTLDGALALLVISDSGNHGAYAVVDPETGVTHEQGKLPLGAAGDDIEGFAARGDTVYGLTSSGWIRTWRRAGHGFELVDDAYPLGPVDLPGHQGGNTPPRGDGMVCGAHKVNCGRNYEGLCLAQPAFASGDCVGFAASKADGHLYCLTEQAGRLVVHHDRAIAITKPGALADCAFALDSGALWAGSNLFDLAQVYQIKGWNDPATATVTRFARLGVGFPEVIAARGDVLYRMSDTGVAPSLLNKYRCAP